MEYQAGIQFLQKILLTTGRCVVPLYRLNSRGVQEFVGSSVYCGHANLRLLFTARHVVEVAWPDRFLYPHTTDETRLLPCDGFHTTAEGSDDFCIAELTSELSMWIPFPYEQIDVFSAYREYQHLLIGYPGSFTKGSTRQVQKLKLQGYLTSAAAESEYTRLGVDPSKELVVLFKKENVYDEDHACITFPDPNGMSGGGVFQFNENIPHIVSLVGIMTRWDTSRKNAIVATRIEAIKSLFSLRKLV